MNIKLLCSLPVAATLLVVPSRANAMSFTTFETRGAFEAALGTNGLYTETFDNVRNAPDFRNSSVSVGNLTLSDNSGFRAKIAAAPDNLPTLNINNTPAALLSARSTDGATFAFKNPITAFGGIFAAISNDGRDTRAVFNDGSNLAIPFRGDGGSLIGDGFFGFIADSPFETFKFRRFDDSLADGFSVDNVAFGTNVDTKPPQAVPTPALLPGIIGFGIAALRKRKQSR